MLNDYEQKIQNKKDRHQKKAMQLKQESNEIYNQIKNISSFMSSCQPMFDVNYRKRLNAEFDKAIETQKKSQYYERKSQSVGMGGISNYDPEAVKKITAKIEKLKTENEYMKEANKFWRKLYNKSAKVIGVDKKEKPKYGASPEEKEAFFMAVEEFKKSDEKAAKQIVKDSTFYAFPPYARLKPYQPETAEIRRLEKRLKDLKSYSEDGTKEIAKNGYNYIQNVEEMRLIFKLDEKPNEEIKNILKRHGFKWSPNACAWVRKLTDNALWSARIVMEELDQVTNQ